MEYNDYLKTPHWQRLRSVKLRRNPLCQVCKSSQRLHVHHKYYVTKGSRDSILFKEPLTALITLCVSCHRLIHQTFGIEVQKLNKKICRIRRLMDLGCTRNMAFKLSTQDEVFYSIKEKLLEVRA